MGVTNTWQCGATLSSIDEGLILRSWKWYVELVNKEPSLARSTYVLIEMMQKVCRRVLEVEKYNSAHHLRRQLISHSSIPARKLPGHTQETSIIFRWEQAEFLARRREIL